MQPISIIIGSFQQRKKGKKARCGSKIVIVAFHLHQFGKRRTGTTDTNDRPSGNPRRKAMENSWKRTASSVDVGQENILYFEQRSSNWPNAWHIRGNGTSLLLTSNESNERSHKRKKKNLGTKEPPTPIIGKLERAQASDVRLPSLGKFNILIRAGDGLSYNRIFCIDCSCYHFLFFSERFFGTLAHLLQRGCRPTSPS